MQASSPLPPLSPRTKWLIALCLCVLVMLLEFLTYHMAYRIGYDEGMLTTPPVVVQKSDEKAMQNLSRFMADVLLRARAWPAFWTTGRNALHGSGIRNCGQKLPGVSPVS